MTVFQFKKVPAYLGFMESSKYADIFAHFEKS